MPVAVTYIAHAESVSIIWRGIILKTADKNNQEGNSTRIRGPCGELQKKCGKLVICRKGSRQQKIELIRKIEYYDMRISIRIEVSKKKRKKKKDKGSTRVRHDVACFLKNPYETRCPGLRISIRTQECHEAWAIVLWTAWHGTRRELYEICRCYGRSVGDPAGNRRRGGGKSEEFGFEGYCPDGICWRFNSCHYYCTFILLTALTSQNFDLSRLRCSKTPILPRAE